MKVVAELYAENDRLERENNQLKENNRAMQEEMARTWKKLDVIKELKSWLEEQEKRAWDEVSSTFGYVLDKLNELEGVNNGR